MIYIINFEINGRWRRASFHTRKFVEKFCHYLFMRAVDYYYVDFMEKGSHARQEA